MFHLIRMQTPIPISFNMHKGESVFCGRGDQKVWGSPRGIRVSFALTQFVVEYLCWSDDVVYMELYKD